MGALDKSLEEYADERKAEFIRQVLLFKRRENLSYRAMAKLCEVSDTVMYGTISDGKLGNVNVMLRISMGTGVQI